MKSLYKMCAGHAMLPRSLDFELRENAGGAPLCRDGSADVSKHEHCYLPPLGHSSLSHHRTSCGKVPRMTAAYTLLLTGFQLSMTALRVTRISGVVRLISTDRAWGLQEFRIG